MNEQALSILFSTTIKATPIVVERMIENLKIFKEISELDIEDQIVIKQYIHQIINQRNSKIKIAL